MKSITGVWGKSCGTNYDCALQVHNFVSFEIIYFAMILSEEERKFAGKCGTGSRRILPESVDANLILN
jgi:hypothetical protein